MVEDSNNDILHEWSVENLDLIHLIESSSNKLLSILGPILISGTATNQVGFPSICPNNVNTSKSDGKYTITMDSTIGNKETGESNEDAKVVSEV